MTITAKEAGHMIDYLDRRKIEFEKKLKELEAEMELIKVMRDHYQQLWLSLEKEEKSK